MSLMSNFFGMGGGGSNGNSNNPFAFLQRLQQFAQNPFGALMSMNPNLNIPSNLSNNPQAMVQHLLQTGKMTQEQFDQFSQTANQMQNMFPRF